MAISSNPEPCYRCEELEEEIERLREKLGRRDGDWILLHKRSHILAEIEQGAIDSFDITEALAAARRRVMDTYNETLERDDT